MKYRVANLSLWVIGASTALALTACGGGGGGSDTSSPSASTSSASGSPGSSGSGTSSGASGNNSGSSTPASAAYVAVTPATDAMGLMTLVNNEGAQGYAYVGDFSFSGDGTSSSIFMNTGEGGTYTYQLLPDVRQNGVVEFLAQANAEGANGYYIESFASSFSAYGTLYRKGGKPSTVFTYKAVPYAQSLGDFISQVNGNEQGAWLNGPIALGGVDYDLYMQPSDSNYTYDVPAFPASSSDFVTQANGEGAKGYRHWGFLKFGDGLDYIIYVKNISQPSTYTYQTAATPTTSASFIQQANNFAAQGYYYRGYFDFGDGEVFIYYNTLASAS